MSYKLVVDIRHAASAPTEIFSDGWRWPIPQSQYDELTRNLIEWFDELHHDLNNAPYALAAFQLIKPDLIKELTCFACALLEVSISRTNADGIAYGDSEDLFHMIDSDRYTDYSSIRFMRTERKVNGRSTLRSWAARQKRGISRRTASRQSTSKTLALNLNPIANQIAPSSTKLFRFDMSDLNRIRKPKSNIPKILTDLTDHIVRKLQQIFGANDVQLSSNAEQFIRGNIQQHFENVWSDFSIPPVIKGVDTNSILLTGTGGNYAARVITQQFWREGAKVVRTSHGGDTPLFKEWVWPNIELPFTTAMVMFGAKSAETIRHQVAGRSEAALPMYPAMIEASGSTSHSNLWTRSATLAKSQTSQRVTVVAASFTSTLRAVPHKKLQDVVYYEWHHRLLKELVASGFDVLSKRHPKGLMSDQNMFADTGAVELLRSPMTAVENSTDAYVIDFPGTALLEALCTKKTVVLIDLPIKVMTDEARTSLGQAAQIVSATFDDRNRVIINTTELKEALSTPVDMNAREHFVQEFLLAPTEGMAKIQDELAKYD